MTSYLITGGTGTFGTAFVRRLLADNLSDRVCVFSRGEHRQQALREELDNDPRCRWLIGDVRDCDRLELAMRGVDVVVHAAALKVITTCENDPHEAIKTNVLGSMNVVTAALRAGVKKVMFISTDKAAASSTLYGSTKFTAERMVISSNVYSGAEGTRFSAVRYGNVIGSAGSIVPLFKRLAEEGATELPITSTDMTRFFWEVEDAVEFTLSSIKLMRGGEVFIPKLTSHRIVDVARTIAPHLPHKIIGIRPGEKLAEILISEDESRNALELADRYVLCPLSHDWDPSHLEGAKPVPEGFRFGSDTSLADMIEAAE